MKIVLVEEGDAAANEKVFDFPTIAVGRDAGVCQLVFDAQNYSAVSRRHAELQYKNDQWWLIDVNSSHGTFLDERRVTEPTPIKVNSRIQFGANGPTVLVKAIESDFGQTSSRETSVPDIAVLELLDDVREATKFELNRDVVTIGRAPENDFAFISAPTAVSRRHAEIHRQNNGFVLIDNHSFNGTFLNERRLTAKEPAALTDDDRIQLGQNGPLLRFRYKTPENKAASGASSQTSALLLDPAALLPSASTVAAPDAFPNQPQLLRHVNFNGKSALTVGRAVKNDIRLDALQVSNAHARLLRTAEGVYIEDTNSTNGVYVGGKRLAAKQLLAAGDVAQIGPYQLCVAPQLGGIAVFDTRAKTRLDAVNLSKTARTQRGEIIKLLHDVSLSIEPNEFVGLLGASGAGKSTLIDALNGMRPASEGAVYVNDLNFYRNLDALKQSVGYVPQNDLLHNELTVESTLSYVARLRLSGDVSSREIKNIVNEVLDVIELAERRDVPISKLSGGQRKRVGIGLELVTKPSVVFLDEPTSGLDPTTETRIMRLFRQIAESGRTIVLTTHSINNIRLFNKIIVLMRGRLVFYGAPTEALTHFGAANFSELYDKLENSIDGRLTTGEPDEATVNHKRGEEIAVGWQQKFLQTELYRQNILEPLAKRQSVGLTTAPAPKRRLGLFGAFRQFWTLARRYAEVLGGDRLNLIILLAQAPIIALMTFAVVGQNQPRDFLYFVLAIVAVWFGASIAAREIVRERPIYNRERMVNIGLVPYLGSKIAVLGLIVALQCLLLFLPLKILDLIGATEMPAASLLGVPQLGAFAQFGVLLVTGLVGVALGLLVSALVRTGELATSLVPLILIPQILFSGLIGVPQNAARVIGLTMPAAWSFDALKRLSGLDTLQPEGSDPRGANEGRGLYQAVERRNDELVAETREELEVYRRDVERAISDYKSSVEARQPPAESPSLKKPPSLSEAERIPENTSDYVNFLHPWMNTELNIIVLLAMFGILTLATIIVLRWQDVR